MPLRLSNSPDPPSALLAADRSGEWQADPGYGVYVHVPFCRHRCHYCDFNTYEGLDELHEPYVDALVREIETAGAPSRPATSVFVGGGTPTLLAPVALARVLDAIRASTGISPGAEVTVEANPETVDETTFEALLGAGFNRFSVGVQSLAPHVLERLGRTHSAETALAALAAARRAGATDLNADLIFGSPWEAPDDWRQSLEGIVAAGTTHVSAYALTVEEGTPLATLVATGRVPDVDPDVQAERHGVATEVLGAAGFVRYEVSNWARPGHASRHNVLYWSGGDYAGYGAGAHGHESGRRYWRKRLPRDYVDAVATGTSTEAGEERLSPGESAREAMTLGLRLASGVDEAAFFARHPEEADALLATAGELRDEGLLVRQDGRLRLSDEATLVANDVLCRFL
ncbi:MAG TPA: radical SAM family heme chaperone HemW [Actinomycetota bacterium]|nr:radical SAM family heme chaperone HemW [Actinomycetota bacterium]